MNKKRFTAALLCVLMVLSSVIMPGCSPKESDNNEGNAANTASTRQLVTLNMYMITNDETDLDSARAVQMAINEITVPKYKTTIKINYLKQSEYWAAVEEMEAQVAIEEEKLAAEAAAKKEAEKNLTTKEKKALKKAEEEALEKADEEAAKLDAKLAEEFTELIDEVFEAKDIELKAPQIDIMLVDSPEMLTKLINEERLAPVDEYLSFASKTLKTYLYPTFLATAKINGKTWGVPTNGSVGGEYEYFVYNKDLLDKYNFKINDLVEVRELKAFLDTIKVNEPAVVPMTKPTALSGFEFYGKTGDALGVYKKDTSTGWDTDIHPIFDDVRYFYRHCLAIEDYRNCGYFAENYPVGSPFAIDVRTSSQRPPEEFSEDGVNYVTYIYKLPRAQKEEVLNATMAISSLSTQKERSMEMITLFNTNEELANLLQYGIKNVNYFYDEDTDTVETINNSYSMNPEYTGNRYIKFVKPGEENYIAESKALNIDSVAAAFIGFMPKFEDGEQAILDKANVVANKYFAMLESGEMTVEAIFKAGKAEMDAIPGFTDVAASILTQYTSYVGSVATSYATPPIVLDRIEKNKETKPAEGEVTANSVVSEGETDEKVKETDAKVTETTKTTNTAETPVAAE